MRLSYRICIMLISACLVASCTSELREPVLPSAPPRAADDPFFGATQAPTSTVVTITFAVIKEEFPALTSLIAHFQADNPDIHVQLVDIDQVAATTTQANGDTITSLGSEALHSVLSLADAASSIGLTQDAITNGWVYDLRPLIDADMTFDRADFYPRTLAPNRNGQIFVMPTKQYVDLLAYNKALWEQQGLPLPPPDWTWKDLKADAQQLTRKRGTTVEQYGMVDWGDGLAALSAELAESGFHYDPDAPVHLNDPALVAALERVVALSDAGVYQAGNDFRQSILDQKVAIWPATPNMLVDSGNASAPQPNFAVGILPRPGSAISVQGYMMSSGTQHPLETWRWLAYLSHHVIAEPFANANPIGAIPARRSVAALSRYWQQLDPDTAIMLNAILDRETPAIQLPDFGAAEGSLHLALEAALRHGLTPAAALDQAQAAQEHQATQATLVPTVASGPIIVATPVPTIPAGATAITFGVPGSSSPIDAIAQAFHQQHPEIFVELRYMDRELGRPTSIREFAEQTDCFAAPFTPTEQERTQLLDLRPLIDSDPGFRLNDYPALALEPFQQSGDIVGLPDALAFHVLFYDQAAFDTLGLAYPTATWTVADLVQAAQQLRRGAGNTAFYGFASPPSQWRDVFFMLERAGVSATSGAGATLQPNFTDPQVVQAIRVYLDLLRTSPPPTRLGGYRRGDTGDSTLVSLIRARRVGMWLDFSDQRGSAVPNQASSYAIAAAPFGQGHPTANDIRVSGLYISAASQHANACWALLMAISNDSTHLQGAIPARSSLANAPDVLSQALPGTARVYQAYQDAWPGPSALTPLAAQSAIDYYWFFQAIDHALQGNMLERELRAAQAHTVQFLACVRAGRDDHTCALQIDPDYQGWR